MGRVRRGLGFAIAQDRCFSGNEPVCVVARGCATRETDEEAQSRAREGRKAHEVVYRVLLEFG